MKFNDSVTGATPGRDLPLASFDGVLRTLSGTQVAHALLTTFELAIAVLSIFFAANQFAGVMVPPVLGILWLCALIGFAPWAVGRCARSLEYAAAGVQAVAEKIMGQDLNKSGAVGDVVLPEPEVRESIRLVPVGHNGGARLVEGAPEKDLSEFIGGLKTRGLTRDAWMGYRFQSGNVMTRESYDLMMSILTDKVRCVRGAKARYLTMEVDDILARLGLDGPAGSAG